ncbi:glycosyltransferase [Pseudonocardia oroxyli]|uniref:Galactofuranosylgalactofuranosylrhamnosyl-N-acetylglucosaminyl-diphospho-decaprenol beta-1,5/1,6-galactofuranosyltransferase n=1 Tax=Pseudonocardia oroxyli TaxID=366584 RepID=A0A1G7M529_PSEOR|nr:glycosyltransferase [Pseudonocardia oroxyli]SDF56877.1 galactofuranosylgalactofuranosylrhamnosyl-N-acetylglucosaminyl-diphospho-decaprenol beta-1,5/1,6-galactofuranosyltransferase [Pseudonocardia oroxyli]
MTTTTGPDAAPATAIDTLLQRIILPRQADPLSVRALYVDERTGTALAPTTPQPGTREKPMTLTVSASSGRALRVTSRTSAVLPPQSEVSFGAYFNGFAAGYWRHWSALTELRLKLSLEGEGRVDVYRSKADGSHIYVTGEVVSGEQDLDLALDLRPFEDGGWYWFDLTSADAELTLHGGGWHAPTAAPGRAAVTIGMPTFNRPADCVATLTAIASDPEVLATVTAVILPDQGTQKVRDAAGFAAAADALGDKLRIIDQPNLGGSGGYARVMYEALGSTDCEQILYMDDDILLEPDSILRAVAFSRFAREPMLVGGQMLSLQARSQLSTMGEVVDRNQFMWRVAPETEPHHDLAAQTLRQTPWLHRRVDVDYNAWWMCLIPRVVAEDLGLPLPLFIKWDDAEYGLRARGRGYRTATVPGIAIWHMSFIEKDDSSDWQAYFHYRNRFIAAALHGPESPKAMLQESFKRTLRHLMLMEYSAVALQIKGLTDFLAGPESLFATLPGVLGEVRAERARYDDGRPLQSATEVPLSTLDALGAQLFPEPPVGRLKAGLGLARGIVRNLKAPDPAAATVPQRNVPWTKAQWFVLSNLDSATVSTPDGRGVTFRRRDPEVFKQLVKRSAELHRQVQKRWPELRASYREAQPWLTGREAWRDEIFEH